MIKRFSKAVNSDNKGLAKLYSAAIMGRNPMNEHGRILSDAAYRMIMPCPNAGLLF
jgi:hypothetical protein